MNLLNRYLLKQFGKYFLTVNFGLIALYLLIDFFEKFDRFTSHQVPMDVIAQFFILSIPSIVDQLGPIFILLSGVITLGILNHSNELTALKAGGLPLRIILRPLLMGSVILTLLFILAAQFLLPHTITITNKIWIEDVEGKTPTGIVRNNRYYYRGSEGFYSFKWPDTTIFKFNDFSYSTWDSNHDLKDLYSSQAAYWNPNTTKWTLINGQIQSSSDDTKYSTTSFSTKDFSFPETPNIFLTPQIRGEASSLTALYTQIGSTDIPYEKLGFLVRLLKKISFITLGIPLLILGLPILLIVYDRFGKDLSIAIPASCGIAFGAWGIWGALQSLAIAGKFSPWMAAVLIHISFISVGLFLLRRLER